MARSKVGLGYATATSNFHALLWTGTAASVVDLHGLLPGSPTTSSANAIDIYGNVAGTAGYGGSNHAVVWYNGDVFSAASSNWADPAAWLSGVPGAGKDVLVIPTGPSTPILNYADGPALGKLTIDNAGGGSVLFNVTAGTLTSTTLIVGLAGNGSLTQSGGTINTPVLAIGSNADLSTGTGAGHFILSGGQLNAGSILLGSTAGGTGSITLNGNVSLKTNSLAIAQVGATYYGGIDLTTNALIVEATDPVDKAAKIATLLQAVAQAQNGSNNTWTGIGGITSSTVAADSTHTLGLALADNASFGYTTFAGQSVDANSLIVVAAHVGDVTLDGRIDIQDLNAVTSHWQQSGALWSDGDTTGPQGIPDGIVDIQDLNAVTSNWQYGTGNSPASTPALSPQSSAFTTSSVPEPTSLALLALAALTLLLRRRARRSYSMAIARNQQSRL